MAQRKLLPETTQKNIRIYGKKLTYAIFIISLLYIGVYGTYVYNTSSLSCFSVSDFGTPLFINSIFEMGLTLLGWSFPFVVILHAIFLTHHLIPTKHVLTKPYVLALVTLIHMQFLCSALAYAAHYPIYHQGVLPFLIFHPLSKILGTSILGWLLTAAVIFAHMLYVIHILYPLRLKIIESFSEDTSIQEKHVPELLPIQPLSYEEPQEIVQQHTTYQKFVLPPINLLAVPIKKVDKTNTNGLQDMAKYLHKVLAEFGVKGTMGPIHPGPVVTLYEFEPAPGIKSARVIGLASDIARSMGVISARIAVIPGHNMMGIELPNKVRETVYFRELIENPAFQNDTGQLTLALGQDIQGTPIMVDLASMPHLLVAGTTGSGKSVSVNAMILSLLYKLKPEQCRLVMIDPKMLELSVYDGIPHLITPVVTDPKKAVQVLKWAVGEMEQRYNRMSKLGVRNLNGYNERVREAQSKGEILSHRLQTGFDKESGHPIFESQTFAYEQLPYIVIVVDEMADLMMVAGKEIEVCVQRLAQMARAAGIHLIMATQRPSVDVITGTIKANFPTRISFHVTSKIDSRTILGEQGAEQLLGQGDMLYMKSGGRISRIHGPFVSDKEVEKIVQHLRAQEKPDQDIFIDLSTEDDMDADMMMTGSDDDDLLHKAIQVMHTRGKISTSLIQRDLRIGYNKAARLVDEMEQKGLVTPPDHTGRRSIVA